MVFSNVTGFRGTGTFVNGLSHQYSNESSILSGANPCCLATV
jgi:hypothetical protein